MQIHVSVLEGVVTIISDTGQYFLLKTFKIIRDNVGKMATLGNGDLPHNRDEQCIYINKDMLKKINCMYQHRVV